MPDSALREKIDRAAEAAVSRPVIQREKAEPQALAEAFKLAENTAVSVLRDAAESGIIKAEEDRKIKGFNPGDFKTEEEVRDWIMSPDRVLVILRGRQDKHREGTNEYRQAQMKYQRVGQFGPSRVTIDDERIAELVQEHAGYGELRIREKGWTGVEIITNNDEVIGIAVNNLNGDEIETDVFAIHYAVDGVHIVPGYPNQKRVRRK